MQNFSYFTTGLFKTDYTLASATAAVCVHLQALHTKKKSHKSSSEMAFNMNKTF